MKVVFNNVEIVEERTKKGRCASVSKTIVSVNAFEQNYRRSLSPKPTPTRPMGNSRTPKTKNTNAEDHTLIQDDATTSTATAGLVEPVAGSARRQRRPAGGRTRRATLSPVPSRQPRHRSTSYPNATSIMHGLGDFSSSSAARPPMLVASPLKTRRERSRTYPAISSVEGCLPLPALCGLPPGDRLMTRWGTTQSKYQQQDEWWNAEENEEDNTFATTTRHPEASSPKSCSISHQIPEQQESRRSTRRASDPITLTIGASSTLVTSSQISPRPQHDDSARSTALRKSRRSSDPPRFRHDTTPTLVLRVPSSSDINATQSPPSPPRSSTMMLMPPPMRGRAITRRRPSLSPARHIKTFNPDILQLGEDISIAAPLS
jgi:hypothetical protein